MSGDGALDTISPALLAATTNKESPTVIASILNDPLAELGKSYLLIMHGEKNVQLGNLIPRKFGFWREIFAILKEILSFRSWIFWSFSYKKF